MLYAADSCVKCHFAIQISSLTVQQLLYLPNLSSQHQYCAAMLIFASPTLVFSIVGQSVLLCLVLELQVS